jgi:Uma2 family endonuclease
MSDLTPQQPTAPTQISAAEYVRLAEAGVLACGDRVELLGGVIVAMPPPGPLHATVTMIGTEVLQRAVVSLAAVRMQLPLALGVWSMPEPDIAVVPGSLRDYLDAHPTSALLVVEVADSSLAQDRLSKSRIYAAAAIPEYWIVNLRDCVVETMRDPDVASAAYRTSHTYAPGDSIEFAALPAARVAVDEILPRR